MVALKQEQENSTTPMTDEEIMATILGKRPHMLKGCDTDQNLHEVRKKCTHKIMSNH